MSLLFANTAVAMFMFLLGCTLLVSLLLKRSYRYFGKTRQPTTIVGLERLPRPQNTWDGSYRDLVATAERQEVEMAEVARDLMGQLTAKTILLEQLVSDSQRQIERMEALLDRMERMNAEK
jgi:hypothetical protein